MTLYTYTAKVLRVVDGDTVTLDIDAGFRMHHINNCRIHGIDTAEMDDENDRLKSFAFLAKTRLAAYLRNHDVWYCEVRKIDSFGRPVVILHYDFEHNVGEHMLHQKLAIPYDGKMKKSERTVRLLRLSEHHNL